MIKKAKIKKNSFVSLQSLSSGMAGDPLFLHRFKIGKQRIANMGLKPLVSKNALKGIDFIKANPDQRAEDLMEAILNKDVELIIANIGGFDSHRIIEFLDKDLIKSNPKPILGYSDITALHLFFYNLGIQTYYGPTTLDGFSENVAMHKITKQSLEDVLFNDKEQTFSSAKEWTSEYLDWANEEFDDISRTMTLEQHHHIWLNFHKNLEGHVIGGCLDTIANIKKLSFFPKIDKWKNAIIFLETSEEKMKPEEFEKSLDLLKEEINVSQALIFGKPKDETYFNEYLDIIKNKITKPVVFNLNFGHTAPLYTIPYGGLMKIEYQRQKITIQK